MVGNLVSIAYVLVVVFGICMVAIPIILLIILFRSKKKK